MKDLYSGFCAAFSMYSIIPVPRVDWEKRTLAYALVFFPWVGAVIGLCAYGLYSGFVIVEAEGGLMAALLLLLPLLLSGAIHLDGLLDTCDALCSRQSRARKLEILKDPHTGAFAIICGGGYFILSLGLWQQLIKTPLLLPLVYGGYVVSRSLSACSVVGFRLAKDTGLAKTFCGFAHKKAVFFSSMVYILACFGFFIWLSPLFSLIFAVVQGAWFFIYKWICYQEFGGLTGDHAGFFLVISEALTLGIGAFGGLFLC